MNWEWKGIPTIPVLKYLTYFMNDRPHFHTIVSSLKIEQVAHFDHLQGEYQHPKHQLRVT